MQLQNKVAAITGAGSGIGRATALLMAENGAKVGAIDWKIEAAKQAVAEIRQRGGEALPVVADVSNPAQMEQAYQDIIGAFGRIDIVFANAGINGVWAPIEDLTLEEWNRVIDINLTGTFLTVKYAVPHLKKQGGSVIINSSINGTRNFSKSGATAYCCTKAAQVTFAKMTALELAKHHIRVNAVCPGAIITNIHNDTQYRNIEVIQEPAVYPKGDIPLTHGYAGSSNEVAQAVLFLASEAANFISGTELWIDGAQSLLKG
ncbi:SDR family oxidoreductase [Altericista sp. CCNU0014]|uniref:SDR family oxidoreductase n=1 Tax=Altericista sp. CCNU0014 TaxID=3082949 RepID=UPI00384EB5B2